MSMKLLMPHYCESSVGNFRPWSSLVTLHQESVQILGNCLTGVCATATVLVFDAAEKEQPNTEARGTLVIDWWLWNALLQCSQHSVPGAAFAYSQTTAGGDLWQRTQDDRLRRCINRTDCDQTHRHTEHLQSDHRCILCTGLCLSENLDSGTAAQSGTVSGPMFEYM